MKMMSIDVGNSSLEWKCGLEKEVVNIRSDLTHDSNKDNKFSRLK